MRKRGDQYLLFVCSWESAEPVTWDLVTLEHLFSELLVALAVLDCIDFKSVRVGVDVMVLCEEVWNGIESKNDATNHTNDNLLIWHLWSSDVSEILRNIMSHLWSWSWSTIFVFNHAIMELWWHSNNHVIKVWVVESALWNIESERWVVVVTGQQVVWVINETWLVRVSLWKFRWPDTIVGILGLMDSEIWSPHSVMNNSLSVVPLLEVITFVFLVSGVDSWSEDHLWHQFSLLETLINKQIVFLMHSSVTTLARSLENLETTSQTRNMGWVNVISYVAEL